MMKKEPKGWQWVERWRNGTISREDFLLFQEALRHDPAVRDTLRQSMTMDSALRDLSEAFTIREAWLDGGAPRTTESSWAKAAALIATGLLFGCLGTSAVWALNAGKGPDWMPISLGVSDGGFESTEFPGDFGYPVLPGIWTGDPAEIVVSGDQGINAFEGNQMLRFHKTTSEEGEGKMQRANRWQIVSLDQVSPNPQPAIGTVSAYFNRVAGGPYTDTQVRVEIAAFSGSPSTAEQQLDAAEFLTRSITREQLDADPANWEEVSSSIIIPPGADFLLIGVAADEDVRNDPPGEVEFDGHYVDAVELSLSRGATLITKKNRKLSRSQDDDQANQ